MFTHPIEVRFRDCDPMGHVNHAVYLSYLEQARFAFWRAVIGVTSIDETGFILARAECDYRSAATLGDPLEVRLRVSSLGRSSFTFDYEIVDTSDQRLVASARTVQVTYDYKAQKSVAVPDALRAKLEQELEARVEAR